MSIHDNQDDGSPADHTHTHTHTHTQEPKYARHKSKLHMRWSENLTSAHVAYGQKSALLGSYDARIEVCATYPDAHEQLRIANTSWKQAILARDKAVTLLNNRVADWALRYQEDNPDMDAGSFIRLRGQAIPVLAAGRELLTIAKGDESYISAMRGELEPAISACEEGIEAVRAAAMQRRVANQHRRNVALVIEGLIVPYRRALTRLLGEGAPPVLALRLPATNTAVEATPQGSSVSLVVESKANSADTGDPEFISESFAGEPEDADDDDSSAAA